MKGLRFFLLGTIVVALAAAFQFLRLWLKGRRNKVYDSLCRHLHLRTAPANHDFGLPEMNATTHHIQGDFEGWKLHVFENVSDEIEEGGVVDTQTVVLLVRKGWNLPRFSIEPHSIAGKISRKAEGKKGIFFPKDEIFTTKHFVDGSNHDAIRAILTADVTNHLHHNNAVHIESRKNALLFYRPEHLLSGKGVEKLLRQALAFANALAKTVDENIRGKVPEEPSP